MYNDMNYNYVLNKLFPQHCVTLSDRHRFFAHGSFYWQKLIFEIVCTQQEGRLLKTL